MDPRAGTFGGPKVYSSGLEGCRSNKASWPEKILAMPGKVNTAARAAFVYSPFLNMGGQPVSRLTHRLKAIAAEVLGLISSENINCIMILYVRHDFRKSCHHPYFLA
jgi:hypothetical protein